MKIVVNKKFEKHVVGFNNSAKPLGERDDLHLLLSDAIGPNGEIRDHAVISYFDEVPSREELDEFIKAEKEKKSLKKATAVKTKASETTEDNSPSGFSGDFQ